MLTLPGDFAEALGVLTKPTVDLATKAPGDAGDRSRSMATAVIVKKSGF
jgi:hypothetical protein